MTPPYETSLSIGQRLRIEVAGRKVWVQVVEIRGGRVRLGLAAPAEVKINRGEIAGAKK